MQSRYLTILAALCFVVSSSMALADAKRQPRAHKASPEFKATRLLRGIPVITTPYLGERSFFEAFDLMVNIPSINQDLRLLEQSQKLEDILKKRGVDFPREPMVDLSGRIEASPTYTWFSKKNNHFDFDLVGAELDVLARITRFGTAFLNIVYDNDPPAAARSFQRNSNSRFYLDQGFFTIGNLNEYPVYLSAGQLYLPFGQYSSNMLSGTLASVLGKAKQRAVVLGFQCQGDFTLHGAIYGFKGDTVVGGRNQGGLHLSVKTKVQEVNALLAAGVISHLAESNGMLSNSGPYAAVLPTAGGAAGFAGFARPTTAGVGANQMRRRVPGINIHTKLNYRDFTFLAEIVFAARRFHITDLRHNSTGARPLAFHVEGGYQFRFMNIPSLVGLGYGFSNEAMSLNIPRHRIIGVLTTALWPSTLQSIQLSHDIGYRAGTIGGRGAGNSPNLMKPGTAGNVTKLQLQFGYYF